VFSDFIHSRPGPPATHRVSDFIHSRPGPPAHPTKYIPGIKKASSFIEDIVGIVFA
jgi:hypothetical protein